MNRIEIYKKQSIMVTCLFKRLLLLPLMALFFVSEVKAQFEAGAKDLADQPHMNALDLTFVDPNSIEQKWSMIQPGKEGHSSVLKLHRES